MSSTVSMPAKYRVLLFFALITAGLAGNHFNYTIFFNVDFIFGSIFAMLALQFFGLGGGIIAAAAISGYTYILWNHPYAIIIMTAEVCVVGLLMTRRKMGMVLADALYWLFIGIPLIYLFYHLAMGVQYNGTYMIMTKQAVNGIANALIARIIFSWCNHRFNTVQIPYNETIYNLLTFFALSPTLIIMAVSSRSDFAVTDRAIRTQLVKNSHNLSQSINLWLSNRENVLEYITGNLPLRLLQQDIESYAKENLLNYTLLDKNGIIITTNCPEQKMMSPIKRGIGVIKKLDNGISQWIPGLQPSIPAYERWMKSFYLTEAAVGDKLQWKLVLEQPVAPSQNKLYDSYTEKFALLLITLLISLGLAEILSRRSISMLLNSEERFRSMFTNHSAIMLLIDPASGAIAYANMAAEKYYGYPRAVLLTMNITEINILPPNQVKHEYTCANSSEKNYFIFQHRLASGAIRTVEVHSTPITVSGNQLLFSIVHDITDRKMAEDAVQDSRARLTHIINGTKAGTWEWNVQTGEAIFNEQWATLIGYTLDEISPVSIETWIKFAHPDDLTKSNNLLAKHFSGELPYYEFEGRMKHKNGEWIWVLDRGQVASWTEDGKPLWMFGTHQEITRRKQAEEALLANKNRLNAMVSNISDVIGIISDDGIISYKSPNIEKWFGWHPLDLVGTDGWMTVHPDDLEGIQKEFFTLLETPNSIKKVEYRYKCKDGAFKPISLTATNMINNPVINGVLLNYHDITERKQAEEELMVAKHSAVEASQAKSRFLAIVAHEFYTPLHLLTISIDILEQYKGQLSDTEQSEQHDQIRCAAQQLTSLITSVSDFNKLGSETAFYYPVQLDIGQLCAKIFDEVKKVWGGEHNFQLSIAADCGTEIMNDTLFRRILLNLLTNAFRFTPPGGDISLVVYRRDNRLKMEIRDTGIGILDEDREKIFDAFFRGGNVDARKGLGLGLSIVNDAIQRMNGTLSVKSVVGEGSVFYVELPIATTLPQ